MIIYLVNPLLKLVGPVNGLCIVVGDFSGFACSSNGISFFVDKTNEFSSLFVSNLNVLADHLLLF